MIKSAYIHIPFCNNICFYCAFCKMLKNDAFVDKYLNSLEKWHVYWIYIVKDYAKAQIFPLVLGWAKTENVKQYYKERDSYLLYIER